MVGIHRRAQYAPGRRFHHPRPCQVKVEEILTTLDAIASFARGDGGSEWLGGRRESGSVLERRVPEASLARSYPCAPGVAAVEVVHPRPGVEAVVATPEQLAQEPGMNNLRGNDN
jgi:hypothetical protein